MRLMILQILLYFNENFQLWHLRLINFRAHSRNEYINNKYCMKVAKMTKHPQTIVLFNFDYERTTANYKISPSIDYILYPCTLRTVLSFIANSRKVQNDPKCLKIDLKRLSL